MSSNDRLPIVAVYTPVLLSRSGRARPNHRCGTVGATASTIPFSPNPAVISLLGVSPRLCCRCVPEMTLRACCCRCCMACVTRDPNHALPNPSASMPCYHDTTHQTTVRTLLVTVLIVSLPFLVHTRQHGDAGTFATLVEHWLHRAVGCSGHTQLLQLLVVGL